MTTIVELERHQLSNGDIVRVTRLGRSYNFNRLFHDDSAPYCELGIGKKKAYQLLAGALRADVLELD